MATPKKQQPNQPQPAANMQRPPAELLYADELARLAAQDAKEKSPRPPGWARRHRC